MGIEDGPKIHYSIVMFLTMLPISHEASSHEDETFRGFNLVFRCASKPRELFLRLTPWKTSERYIGKYKAVNMKERIKRKTCQIFWIDFDVFLLLLFF